MFAIGFLQFPITQKIASYIDATFPYVSLFYKFSLVPVPSNGINLLAMF